MKKIFAISGSTRHNSSNEKLIRLFAAMTAGIFDVTLFESIATLPHFNPDLDKEPLPETVKSFRQQIAEADGVLICTPEYVFSLPGSFKNAIEWCVSTTLFAHKPTGLITASASGEKAQEELLLIMKTVEAKFNTGSSLLIQGVRGKIDENGKITNTQTQEDFERFITAFKALLNETL